MVNLFQNFPLQATSSPIIIQVFQDVLFCRREGTFFTIKLYIQGKSQFCFNHLTQSEIVILEKLDKTFTQF